jgi:iron-sulfur cluster repair protein YtfE (RIC family)
MSYTDKFRTQHDEILALATGITGMLEAREPDAGAVRRQLSVLAGKVNIHLAMEDKALYPRLMERKGSRTHAVASRYMTEMGGLAQVFSDYTARWQVSAIRADMPGFANDTRKVFGALAQRIERETTELYPLADREASEPA